jgi:hypothetical protein
MMAAYRSLARYRRFRGEGRFVFVAVFFFAFLFTRSGSFFFPVSRFHSSNV